MKADVGVKEKSSICLCHSCQSYEQSDKHLLRQDDKCHLRLLCGFQILVQSPMTSVEINWICLVCLYSAAWSVLDYVKYVLLHCDPEILMHTSMHTPAHTHKHACTHCYMYVHTLTCTHTYTQLTTLDRPHCTALRRTVNRPQVRDVRSQCALLSADTAALRLRSFTRRIRHRSVNSHPNKYCHLHLL